jgi:hypothetical protein
MISSLSGNYNYFSYLPRCFDRVKALVSFDSALIQKIYHFSLPYFKGGSSIFLCSYGALEVYPPKLLANASIDSYQQSTLPYLKVHGTLLMGSGICSGLNTLHAFSLIDLGALFSGVSSVGNFTFLFANFVALEENILAYEKTYCQVSETPMSSERLAWERHSAAYGILSNLGYITAMAMALVGASTAVALLVGVVSACMGGLKILYDFQIRNNFSG